MLWQRHITPPHCLSKVKTLNPRVNARGGPPLGLDSFWACRPRFPYILAFWACISLHFDLLGHDFVAFCSLGPSFLTFWPFWSFILALCLPIGLLKLYKGYPLHLWGSAVGPPKSCQVSNRKLHFYIIDLTAPGPRLIFRFFGCSGRHFCRFPLFGLNFLTFWLFGL